MLCHNMDIQQIIKIERKFKSLKEDIEFVLHLSEKLELNISQLRKIAFNLLYDEGSLFRDNELLSREE